jgi:hypothetical protein
MPDAATNAIQMLEKAGYYNRPLDLAKKAMTEILLEYADGWMSVSASVKGWKAQESFAPRIRRKYFLNLHQMVTGSAGANKSEDQNHPVSRLLWVCQALNIVLKETR